MKLAFGPPNLQFIPIARNGDASRVVAAVLQPPKTFDDDRHHFLVPNVSNNATHLRSSKDYSAREQRNSSITGLVSTSRAIRSTSDCASSRLSSPSSAISKYFPCRTSFSPL